MRYVRIATAGVLAACTEVAPAPAVHDLRLASPDVWSGSELVIVTPPIGAGTPVFELFLDSLPLDARRVDDTTLVAQLPDLPGEHRVSALAAGTTAFVQPDIVRLHGFRSRIDRPPLKGNLHIWPAPGRPSVLGVGRTGPALLDLATGALQQWSDTIHGPGCTLGGIGPSWEPDHFVFQGHRPGVPSWDCLNYRVWQLLPTPVPAADTLPTPRLVQAWATAEVAPDRWLATTDDHLYGHDCRAGACLSNADLFWTGGGDAVFISPRGDRVLVNGNPRVLDPETLTILYRLDGLWWAGDAAFSPDGDTLLVVGYGPGDGTLVDRIRAFRPDDGAVLADIPLTGPDGTTISPTGLAYDPVGPWIYVAGDVALDTLRLPALLVVDRSALRPVALIRATRDQATFRFFPYDRLKVVPAPLHGVVYVVWETLIYDPPSAPTGVYKFGRVP